MLLKRELVFRSFVGNITTIKDQMEILKRYFTLATHSIKRYRQVVYVEYSHLRKRYRKSTGIWVPEQYWNSKKNKIRAGMPNYEKYQDMIFLAQQDILSVVINLKSQGIEPTAERVRHHFSKMNAQNQNHESMLATYLKWVDLKSLNLLIVRGVT